MKTKVLVGAWLLALATSAAYALGLGEIRVHSRLNQPLNAEIVVREAEPGEAEELAAKLASDEDFDRVGLERSRLPVQLQFEVGRNDRGQRVIRVTSSEPVREPFLTLLVEANWSGGRLLREYGILLDPEVLAPARSVARAAPPAAGAATPAPAPVPVPPAPRESTSAQTAAVPDAPAAAPSRIEPSRPAQPTAPATAGATTPPASTPPPGFAQPPTPPRPAAPAASTPQAPAAAAAPDSYTVRSGDTLYAIAAPLARNAGVSVDQMMVALHRENPQAFYRDNINGLRSGVVLRVPDADAAQAVARSEAQGEVRRQHSSWTGNAATPALADAGAAPSVPSTPAQTPAADARLALVPPRDESTPAGSSGGTGTGQEGASVAEVQADLQRTREDLRSRDQEVSELASRVRDLEELNAKNARLLDLKNAEVAELQRRLAGESDGAAEASSIAAAAATGVTDAATDDPGMAATEGDAVDENPGDATSAAADLPDATAAGAPADPGALGDVIAATGNDPQAVSAEGEAGAAGDDATAADGDAQGSDAQSEAEWEAAATSAEGDPFAVSSGASGTPSDEPATATWAAGEGDAASAAGDPAAAGTAASEPAAPAAAPVVTTTEPASAGPWYSQPLLLGAVATAVVLLLLLVLLARRQRRSTTASGDARRPVSELFGGATTAAATPIVTGDVSSGAVEPEDAVVLQRQIEAEPGDFGAYLELLGLYYGEGDRERFALWAERFAEQPLARESDEWQAAREMGEELLPGHPLFTSDSRGFAPDAVVGAGTVAGISATESWRQVPAEDLDERPLDGLDDGIDDAVESTGAASGEPVARVIDISGTDFSTLETEPEQRDEDAAPIEFVPDFVATPAPAASTPAGAATRDTSDDGDDGLPPLTFGEADMDEFAGTRNDGGSDDESGNGGWNPFRTDGEAIADRTDGDRYDDADTDAGSSGSGLDDVATKLELARAYLDMGDPDGARAMLEEVLGEGDTSQREEARKLLATL